MGQKHPKIKALNKSELSAIKSIFGKSKTKIHAELKQLRAHFLNKESWYHLQIDGAFDYVLKQYANNFDLNWSKIGWLLIKQGKKVVEVQFTKDGKPIILDKRSLIVTMDVMDFKLIAGMAHKSLVCLDLSRAAHAKLENHVDNAVNKGWIGTKLNKATHGENDFEKMSYLFIGAACEYIKPDN